MNKHMVIVLDYEVDPDAYEPLAEVIEEIRQRMEHPDKPHVKIMKVYAALHGDADEVIAVFDKLKRGSDGDQ